MTIAHDLDRLRSQPVWRAPIAGLAALDEAGGPAILERRARPAHLALREADELSSLRLRDPSLEDLADDGETVQPLLVISTSSWPIGRAPERLHDAALGCLCQGLGPLYVSDTAPSIGAKLGHMPKAVYLHAGTREGAAALGLHGDKALFLSVLPPELQESDPYEVEDVLCIYTDQLGNRSKPTPAVRVGSLLRIAPERSPPASTWPLKRPYRGTRK